MRIADLLLDYLLPRYCEICGHELTAEEQCLCAACTLHLPYTHHREDLRGNTMARLLMNYTRAERAAALFHYQPGNEACHIIHTIKYSYRPQLAITLGRIAANAYRDTPLFDGIDRLVYVPLTRQREAERGYNQSRLIAQGIAQVTGIPVAHDTLRRTEFKGSQTHLRHTERLGNVQDAFDADTAAASLEGMHVMLIDDVTTTGATLAVCANKLLKLQGTRVSCFALGLTS